MTGLKKVLCAAACASLGIGGSVATAASGTRAGGTVRFYITTTGETRSKVLVTGAIGDYGTAVSITKTGKPAPEGNFEKVTLKRGSFEINATNFEKKFQGARPKLNTTTCTVDLSGQGTGSIVRGTGDYQGLTGKLKIRFVLGGLAPRFTSGPKKGTCDLRPNGPALDIYEAILGSGTVRFS
jgi:hypothetical protein